MKALILDLHKNLKEIMGDQMDSEEYKSYQAAFDAFDWGHSGKIKYSSLQAAMRRAGQNPTDIEVLDIINKIDDESGYLDFQSFVFMDVAILVYIKPCGR